ncbi:hypothetical protein BJ085DRAFT_18268 [Dimargaris cristalligena]|uniref:Uncharacterized protein n=1 Tax=Dimargaris cristalligena TaxID=215637 RepID=A0A4P9ZVX9_9FUNG|nr:hypothetical protein BJ085DRAFT_18268 [Dimargaris cristalligena]|eukprot:RKP36810.1 hypothetical protein BJ085DRAFT_18268 [Dimargaris cristalligena]
MGDLFSTSNICFIQWIFHYTAQLSLSHIKLRMPLLLMQNLSLNQGLCNSTCVVVRSIS